MKTLKTKVSKAGVKFALVAYENGTFGVYKLCQNYAAHCKGGMSSTWRYVQKGMTFEAAEILFEKRAK